MKKFLYYTKGERRGILLLCSLIISIFLLPNIYGRFSNKGEYIDWHQLPLDTISFRQNQKAGKLSQGAIPDTLFEFDPNEISYDELCKIGLSAKTAQTLINYRNKGGKFYKNDDLLKIYSIDSSWYRKVAPYIKIKSRYAKNDVFKQNKSISKKSFAKKDFQRELIIAVNQASAEEWATLYGIGPVLSKRIVKFREKLGGFYQLEQVNETYGLADSTFQKIRPYLKIEPKLEKLAVNRINIETLAQHPYFSWKTARIFINYREHHGPYLNPSAVKKIQGIDTLLLQKALPYLDFSE